MLARSALHRPRRALWAWCGFLVAVLSAAAPAFAQSPLGWSLHEFGERLLAQSAARGVTRDKSLDLRDHLAPLHERMRVGAFELWLPATKVDAFGVWSEHELRASERWVVGLAQVQKLWLARIEGPANANAAELALEFDRWAAQWRPGRKAAAVERESALHDAVFEHLHGRPRSDTAYPFIVCLAPSRAQLCAIAGAQVALRPTDASWINVSWLSHCREFVLPNALAVVSQVSVATDTPAHEMRDEPLGVVTLLENLLHNASHLLSAAHHDGAPQWWKEGLAIYDTLSLIESEDSLCSGAGDASESSKLSPLSQWMFVMSRHKSRYRGRGVEGYFVGELRRALRPGGFELLDLDTNRPALIVPAPHLGEHARIPQSVQAAPPTVRKAYAEHLRAYSVAFLSYLDRSEVAKTPSRLQAISRELARLGASTPARGVSLYAVVRTLTGSTLGESNEPKLDLEGAFMAWLAGR